MSTLVPHIALPCIYSEKNQEGHEGRDLKKGLKHYFALDKRKELKLG